jgi:penicillin-binding protein 1A
MSGVRRKAKPQGRSRKPAGSRGPTRRRPPSKRRPSSRRPKGRFARLRRTARAHPYLFKALRFSLLAAIWGTIALGGAVVYFISQVPDPLLATLDDRPPNVTVLAADGTVLAERGLRCFPITSSRR